MTEECEHCGQDLVTHHPRNLQCPGLRSIFRRKVMEIEHPTREEISKLASELWTTGGRTAIWNWLAAERTLKHHYGVKKRRNQ
jgi:hypothetical protein